MDKIIKLNFKKSVTKLAGYAFGKSTYEEQVKEQINFNEKIVIEFPDNIDDIASSFVQGFFYELVDIIGIKGIQTQVDIVSHKESLKDEILNNLI